MSETQDQAAGGGGEGGGNQGGQGGGQDDAARAAAAAAAAAGNVQGEGQGEGGSLFDLANEDDGAIKKDDRGKAIKPDWITDEFWDAEKGEIRTRELAKSRQDLRTKVARGEGKIPDKADGYVLPKVEGLTAEMIPADDPLWVATRTAAHKAGITQTQLDTILSPYLQHALEAVKAKDPTADREAMRQAAEAELKSLGPNARMVVKDVGAWIDGMEARGSLTAGEKRALKGIGSADGIRALMKLRELSGEKPMPLDHLVADTMSESDARALLLDGKMTNDQAKVDRAKQALTRLEKAGVLRA